MDHTMMAAQAMGHAPFFYYAPEHNLEAKQHGVYAHQPGFQQQTALYPMVPTLPSTPVYSRPNSACSQPAAPTLYSNGPMTMTPMASPQPVAHKPSIMLETEISESENYPSTPPLSTSGSVISSPNSCDVLQTPMNPMFSGLDGLEGVKGEFEPAETLVLDWASCQSPPMTPVYFQSEPGKAASLNTTSDLLSTASCPSLSPSPSPYDRSVAPEEDISFCDPRKLTVGVPATANPTLAPAYTALATLGEDEQLRGDAFAKVPAASAVQPTFDFNPAVAHGLPTFDDLSDLESDDDFSSLVNVGDHTAADVRRPRACTGSSVVSLGHGSFIGEDDLSFDETEPFPASYLPSPSCSAEESDCHQDKRIKSNKGTPKVPVMTQAATDAQSGGAEQKSSNQAVNESKSSSGSEAAPATPLPAPVNRRGRKQSLTEDPSKTFVCDLCNRRFRRQEHLKRHYRSLHTQEKPFECTECGKKFSRSDNLAQHARTHGSGAIVMDLIDNADLHGMPMAYHEDYHTLGKVLFQVAADMPGSASELSSEEGVSDHGKKKRKRTD